MRCDVKGVLVLYSPTAATPAIEPMVIPAIAPLERPDELSPTDSVVPVEEVGLSVTVPVAAVSPEDETVVPAAVVGLSEVPAAVVGLFEVPAGVVGLFEVTAGVVGPLVIVMGGSTVVAPHRSTASVKAKRQKTIEVLNH